ncbi:MAG: T9SS type A sorting domain-containing protein [bacterium]|nr:T9SS type A sorting domain-containing protein [bacterium]
MIKFSTFIFIVSTTWCHCTAQSFGEKEAYPHDIRQIHSGHSLTDPLFAFPWPGQYRYMMSEVFGADMDYITQATIPGSPMFWRWDNEEMLEPNSARYNIDQYELLVITEGIPIPGSPGDISEASGSFANYVNNAWENGNNGFGAPTLLWTTWINIDDSDGPFRELLDTYETYWEEMMDYANSQLPEGATPVFIIPGHRMMARIYDDIEDGLVPGINDISELFDDTIHPNELGAYAIAMIHYTCIYNTSPVGLPTVLHYDWELPNQQIPSDELALYFQEMVYEVVTNYERTGVRGEGNSVITSIGQNKETNFVYPNPSIREFTINSIEPIANKVTLMNLKGQLVKEFAINESQRNTFNISDIPDGIYAVFIDDVLIEKLIVRH